MVPAAIVVLLLGVLAYAWLLYPLLLAGVARRRGARELTELTERMPVAVILSAHREEANIAGRVRNLVALATDLADLEFHIGVDGSGDRTAELAREAAGDDARVFVHEFSQQRGKVAVLKDLVAGTHARVLLLTDANTHFHAGAVDRLLRHFADPLVGGVCGRLVLRDPADGGEGGGGDAPETDAGSVEGFYWGWETRLKQRESVVDSCLGANGAIFALRRELFWSGLPVNTVVDDLVIGLKVREQGARVVYEPTAIAEEELPDVSHEWTRRVRIGAGDFQALVLCRGCLAPRQGLFAWMFFSHKVLRWFSPHMGVAIAVLSCVLVFAQWLPGALLGMGCSFLLLLAAAMALLGLCLRCSPAAGSLRLPELFLHFVMMQLALLAGSLRFCMGRLEGRWRRTPRRSELGVAGIPGDRSV